MPCISSFSANPSSKPIDLNLADKRRHSHCRLDKDRNQHRRQTDKNDHESELRKNDEQINESEHKFLDNYDEDKRRIYLAHIHMKHIKND